MTARIVVFIGAGGGGGGGRRRMLATVAADRNQGSPGHHQSHHNHRTPPHHHSRGSNAPGFYNNRILEMYAARETKLVTLRQLTVFGRNLTEDKLLRSANYVREELPVRLAHRIRDFQNLPFIVGTNPHMEELYNLYWDAFERFRTFKEIRSLEDNREFCEFIESMLEKHLVAIPQLAMGVAETSEHFSPEGADRFLNEMLRSRIGRRVLAEQHITISAVYDGREAQEEGWIGIVNTRCRASEVVQRCAAIAADLFVHEHPTVKPPTVILDGDVSAHFTYIPDHIEYILFELLKNSMRFIHDHHARDLINADSKAIELPPVRVTVGSSDTTITFRVSDQGGGIQRSALGSIWSYTDESKRRNWSEMGTKMPAMAGKMSEAVPESLQLGMGLPMSRVYANYWGGSLTLQSMVGYGTDAYVKIATGNQHENLTYSIDE